MSHWSTRQRKVPIPVLISFSPPPNSGLARQLTTRARRSTKNCATSTDPDFVPPGGESVTQLCERVAAWLDGCSERNGRIVVVTHPAVVRAAIVTALQAPLAMFWRIDVAPLTQTRFRYRNGWTLRIGEPSVRRE
jgi:broad specificity phosphatase PhoE